MAIKFAGQALPAIKAALGAVMPQTKLGAAFRFGPELAYAGLSALVAPEGTSAMGRAGMVAEDLAIGLGSSLIGQLGGLAAGRRAIGKGKALSKFTQEERKQLENYLLAGDALAGPLNFVAPRPVSQGIYRDLSLEQQQLQQAQYEAQMQEREQALIQALLGGGSALLR